MAASPATACVSLLPSFHRFTGLSSTQHLPSVDTEHSHRFAEFILTAASSLHPHYLSPHRTSPPPHRPFSHPQFSPSLHIASHKHPSPHSTHPTAGPSPGPSAAQEPADPRSIMWEPDGPSCSLGVPRPCRPAGGVVTGRRLSGRQFFYVNIFLRVCSIAPLC